MQSEYQMTDISLRGFIVVCNLRIKEMKEESGEGRSPRGANSIVNWIEKGSNETFVSFLVDSEMTKRRDTSNDRFHPSKNEFRSISVERSVRESDTSADAILPQRRDASFRTGPSHGTRKLRRNIRRNFRSIVFHVITRDACYVRSNLFQALKSLKRLSESQQRERRPRYIYSLGQLDSRYQWSLSV